MAELDELLNTFSGRKPSYDARGRVRGLRSRPGAPQAESSGITSAVDWVGRFNTAGRQMRNAARSDLGLDPLGAATPSAAASDPAELQSNGYVGGMPAGWSPDTGGGIAQQTIDGAFGPGHWNRMLGRAPDLMTPKPFMPGQQGTFRGAPKPLTGPLGNKASDRAGLAANQALYAPGGMTGLWSKPRQEQWQSPGLAGVSDVWKKYGAGRTRA